MKNIYFILGFLFISNFCFTQESKIDSLQILIKQSDVDTTKVQLMLNLSKMYFGSDPNKAILISEQAKALSESINYGSGVAYSLKNIGLGYYHLSDYVQAVLYWQKAKSIFENINDVGGVSNMLNNIGAVYSDQGAHVKSLELFLQSLKLAEEVKDTTRIASALLNISMTHQDNNDLDLAINALKRALPLFESMNNNDEIGITLLFLGRVYEGYGDSDLAIFYFQKSMEFLKNSTTYYPDVLMSLGNIYLKTSDYEKGLKYLNSSYKVALESRNNKSIAMTLNALASAYEEQGEIELAIELYEKSITSALELSNFNSELRDAYDGLMRLYFIQGNKSKGYEYQSLHLAVKDSINSVESLKAENRLLFKYEIEKKEGEIDFLEKENEIQKAKEERQKLIRNIFIYGFIVMLVLASVIFIQRNKIKKGKKLSDKLLHNILPDEVAAELKEKGKSEAKNFENVAVIFSDFKGFTSISEHLSAQELVAEINTCFKAFDKIITSFGIEKIKTIGDSYMAAGGLHIPRTSTTKDVIMAGLEMQAFMEKRKVDLESQDNPFFEMRVGIHVGPVVAGVVGNKKFQYDIWGDTVNIASRMESNGQVGKVNISKQTYELFKEDQEFTFEKRGKIQAKGKGEIEMYFVERSVS